MIFKFRMWLNAITADEGCTMVDARKLREYNHGLAEENARLREAVGRIEEIYMDGEDTYEDWQAMGEIARRALVATPDTKTP